MFTNKEEYLQYRRDWKQRYAALSQTIRDLKFCRKGFLTIEATPGGRERYERTKKAHQSQWGFFPQSLCLYHRARATDMLLELKEAKQNAQKQYLARKAELAATQ